MAECIYPYLSSNIKNLRRVYGEEQVDLANAIGLTIPAVSNYERGERVPKRDIIARIAKHYRITEDELLYCDLSNMKTIADRPFYDPIFSSKALDILFPLMNNPRALENENFKQAYSVHTKYLELIRHEAPLPESVEEDIPRCLELYKKSRDEGVVEGAANHLSVVMMMGALSYFATSFLLEDPEYFRKKGRTMKDYLHNGFLPSFDDSSDETTDAPQVNKRKFLDEYEAQILIDIYHLKHSPQYVDLGDYYFALRYMFDLCSNSQSSEQNTAVGAELMNVYSVMKNPFAQKIKSISP